MSKKASNRQRKAASEYELDAKRNQSAPLGTKIFDLSDDAFSCIGQYLDVYDIQRLLMTQRAIGRIPIFICRLRRMVESMRELSLPKTLFQGVASTRCSQQRVRVLKKFVAQFVNVVSLSMSTLIGGERNTSIALKGILYKLKSLRLVVPYGGSFQWACSVATPRMVNLTRLDTLHFGLYPSQFRRIAKSMPLLRSLRVLSSEQFGDYAIFTLLESLHVQLRDERFDKKVMLLSLPPSLEKLEMPGNDVFKWNVGMDITPNHLQWLSFLQILPTTLVSLRIVHFQTNSNHLMENYFGPERWYGGVLNNVIIGRNNEWMREPHTGVWRNLQQDLEKCIIPETPYSLLKNQGKLHAYGWPLKLASLCYRSKNLVVARRILAILPSQPIDFDDILTLIAIACDADGDGSSLYCHWLHLIVLDSELFGIPSVLNERAQILSDVLLSLANQNSHSSKQRMKRFMVALYVTMCTSATSPQPSKSRWKSLLASFGFDECAFMEKNTALQCSMTREMMLYESYALRTQKLNQVLDAMIHF